ncbi:hypothetical protein [Actinoplanes sp. NBRC 103695]|uniref:hypothetical protein n=1 Tax=Actinoplanes sp. NBRC 103695 TaxID=3032202 RepID=UPI0024A1151F|nr:hypothetical protein [Actinoplanes sp. NBRC 103695]GLY98789.1 hypothetical protein Acsp02_60430 [Actinoplanes sp. NBRC 103695]
MPLSPLAAAVRRFPLLGRPRPDCPALPLRVQEVVDAVDGARQKPDNGMAGAAHALNKAALIASDSGMTDLARHLCWQHIDTYRRAERPLTILEARYLLEPVLNLARLQIRTDQGTAALHLLESMYQTVTRRSDLTVENQTLPMADLVGGQQERRQLREWVWLQLIGEGVRALALAGRWVDAAEHARSYSGIGVHLMEGRQAAIIARCMTDAPAEGRALLAQSVTTEPWEQEIAGCLHLMCTDPSDSLMARHLTTAMARFTARTPAAGYASYRARLGLTLATLASPTRPDLAKVLLGRIATEAVDSKDGYAARDVLGFREPIDGITERRRTDLNHLAAESGLGIGALPERILRCLTATADEAVAVLDTTLCSKGSRQVSRVQQ